MNRGTRVPLLAGACGRIVLASWPLERRQAWLRKHPLPRFTEHSLTDAEQFLTAAEITAANGLAIDHEEYLTGVNAIAVPIHGLEHSLVALLCILGFTSHFDDQALQIAGRQLRTEAEGISRALGAR